MTNWGRAARFDFDNPQKWVTVPSIPLLDEHVMTDDSGRPVATVDKSILEQIAANNNKRVVETGDPATLILGHTSDDPRAEEKPAKGFVTGYTVKPFKRDPKTGQVVYAIHGDFKLRPENAQLLEEYPRRSVELWWHKKELDPIALLGGTSPERDLGVVIRKARLKHLALLGSSVPERDLGTTVRFSRHGGDVIESYSIDHDRPIKLGRGKVEKVMSEFKNGTLHSGSKHGPKVTSRDQAVAIAMNEAGKTKKSREDAMPKDNNVGRGSPRGYPQERQKYNEHCDYKMDYADEDMETEDYDPGDGKVDPNDMSGPGESADQDPTVAKVFQSRQFKELIDSITAMKSQVQQIADALAPEPEPGVGDGMGPPPPGEGMGEGTPGGTDDGVPGAPPSPGGGDEFSQEMEPEDDDRLHHEGNPVKFDSVTAMPGPGNTAVPGVGGKGRRNMPYSRTGKTDMKNPELVRMSRENKELKNQFREMRLKLARSEASAILNQLAQEGVVFGDNPQEIAEWVEGETEYLAHLSLQSEADRDAEVQMIRTKFRRKPSNPAHPVFPGVARYARPQVSDTPEDPEDYEPRCPQEATDLADLVAVKKLSRADAVKFCRKKNYPAFDVSNPNG